jgi:hypothetical protein
LHVAFSHDSADIFYFAFNDVVKENRAFAGYPRRRRLPLSGSLRVPF